MSERKSWDIAPRARKPAPSAAPVSTPAPRPQVRSVPKASARPHIAPVVHKVEKVTSLRRAPIKREAAEPLKKRRRKQRRVFFIVLAVLTVLLLGGALWLTWQPYLRVTAVRIEGAGDSGMQQEIEEQLSGTVNLVFPRNSLFAVPEESIRAELLAEHPNVQSVSLKVEDLHTLVVRVDARQDVFVWCGIAVAIPEVSCYKADAEGMLFGQTAETATSSSDGTLVVYAPLDAPVIDSPLALHIVHPEVLPKVFRFIKALRDMGIDVTALALRNDEADLYTKAGTRITYVLGREEAAVTLAVSALSDVNLNDGSIDYVDLRFESKVYFKKKGSSEEGEQI